MEMSHSIFCANHRRIDMIPTVLHSLFSSKIRMEMSHSIFCTNHRRIDMIATVLHSLMGLNTSIQEKIMEYSMLHRHLNIGAIVWVGVFFPFILDIKFVGRTMQPGSHRRKVTHNFSSTFFLWCVP